MMDQSSDHLRVMHIAAWMWLAYLISLALLDSLIYAGRPVRPVLWYHAVNILPALLFMGLAYSSWSARRSVFFLPFMIFLISAVPLLANHFYGTQLPPAPLSNIEGMALRQLPVLFIGLVLVAWHYGLPLMVFYSIGINLFELLLVIGLVRMNQERLAAFYSVVVIRLVSFLVVGVFINLLISRLRARQVSLKNANDQLSHYASTMETLTVSRERNRMSRELHDTVVHSLSALSLQLETARAYWEVEPQTARELLEQSLQTTRSGLQETRRALKALRASPLEDLGLVIAVREMAHSAAERAGFELELSLPPENLCLSPDVEQCVYRVVQEAVENVVHHANAGRLLLSLSQNSDSIELLVKDDGSGFVSGKEPEAGHYGLAGMQERARLVGGRLSVDSHPGEGTTIRLVVEGCV